MKNPSISKLLENPDMIKAGVNMMKNNPMMKEMLAKQMPGANPEMLVTALDWLAAFAGYYSALRRFFAHKVVQLSLLAAFIYMVYRYLG